MFGPGDKLRWLEAIATDHGTSDFDLRVAVAISNRLDKFIGTATVGQAWIAEYIGGTDRGVRNAVDRLAARGHLLIDRSESAGARGRGRSFGGRGKANLYRPVPPHTDETKTRNHRSGFGADNQEQPFRVSDTETRNATTLNPERRDSKPGTVVPLLPNKHLNSSFGAPTESGDLNSVRWHSIKASLADRLGADVVTAWFEKLTVAAVTEQEAVLIAPTPLVRDRIEQSPWADRLTEAWCREIPTITRVRLVDPVRRAAE